ncbi:sortase domain-containing protein [Nocardioides dongxiaopingii]|uniref:sortase domain-containing protein n=1 Tax=Nocardioides dongxiaopingii TaxID=2576036 RepID=UPI0010C76E99|nr:sortase [Nocardioides dongxiaopingii]
MTSDQPAGPVPAEVPVEVPVDAAAASTAGALSRAPRAPRPARPPAEGAHAVVQTTLVMVAIVCLWTCAQVLVLSGISQDREQSLLHDRFRTQLADLTAPIGPVVPAGDPVALLSVPAIGLEEVVVEGTASGDLRAGPGHRRDTVLPGQVGVSQVYGRAGTYGGPFQRLTSLQVGDTVGLVTAQGERTLRVIGVRYDGDPLPQPPVDGVARLTLVSAVGEGRLSALTPDTTVYVDAETTDGAPAPGGRPVVLPESERAMATDGAALPLLALWLALLLALTLGVVAARQRWSAALVWVLASPLALALAWMTTDTLVRLLPNLV